MLTNAVPDIITELGEECTFMFWASLQFLNASLSFLGLLY